MPFLLIVAITLGVIGAIAVLLGYFADRKIMAGGFAVSAIAALMFVLSGINQVPVRSVGIVTSFGKPTGEVTGSGVHYVAPWKKIAEWDASIQTDDAVSDVRIQTGAVAKVKNKVRWQVRPEAAPGQYQDYKGKFDNMVKNLFEVEKQAAFNEAFADYNPVTAQTDATGKVIYDLGKLGEEVKKILSTKLGKDFVIHSVVIPIIEHDKATQASIEAYQRTVTEGRNLEQKERNTAIEKRIAEALRNLPPEYYVNKCLDLAKELNKDPGFCLTGPPVRVR